MIDVTGSLQIKNKTYQAVLSYKENGKWKTKWVSTKIKRPEHIAYSGLFGV